MTPESLFSETFTYYHAHILPKKKQSGDNPNDVEGSVYITPGATSKKLIKVTTTRATTEITTIAANRIADAMDTTDAVGTAMNEDTATIIPAMATSTAIWNGKTNQQRSIQI